MYMCAVQDQQPAAGKSGEQSSQGSVLSGTLLWVSWQIWRTVKPRQFTIARLLWVNAQLEMQLGTMQASGQTLSLSMTN